MEWRRVCVIVDWGARSALAEASRQRLRRGIVLLRLRACACCYRAVFDGANAVPLFRSRDVDVVCPTAAFKRCERRRIRCCGSQISHTVSTSTKRLEPVENQL